MVLRDGKCPSEANVLIVVRQLQGAGQRLTPLSLYTIEQLKALTEQYAQRQRSRRETEENVYIAGNLTSGGCGWAGGIESVVDPALPLLLLPSASISFTLGDGREVGGYENFPLEAGELYSVAVFGTSRDPNDPVVFAAIPAPFGVYTTRSTHGAGAGTCTLGRSAAQGSATLCPCVYIDCAHSSLWRSE